MSQPVRLVPAETLGLSPRLGLAQLTKRAFDAEDLNPVWGGLVTRLRDDPADVDAAMDMSLVAQLMGHPELGFQLQAEALTVRQLYRAPPGGDTPALTMLAFCAATDIGGNAPIEFLLQGSDIALYMLYVVPGVPLPDALPDHDVAFIAVPESDETRFCLNEIQRLTFNWPRPVLNAPRRIAELERDRLYKLLKDAPGVTIPATMRVDRDDLSDVLEGETELTSLMDDAAFPLILRPAGSQGGKGLEKIDGMDGLRAYLEAQPEEDFFLSRFVDYSGEDGQFRKYRIIFIDGVAYPCHMAIAEIWKLWYLNAGMHESAEKRAEEAGFLLDFDATFGLGHEAALHEIAGRVDLDYFGIDCGVAKDGSLLIFEAEIAMIVHDMDPPDLFPYKHPAVRRMFEAFAGMLRRRALITKAA